MGERPPERDSTQGFRRGSTRGFGRGNSGGFYSQGSLERNERYRQEEEWSIPASNGRGRRDIPISSPTAHRLHPKTLPTPASSEDRFVMDWSSIRSGSSLVRSPPQSISAGDALTTHGIEGGHETDQIALQPTQLIPEQTHMGVADDALQGNLPITPTIH